MSWLPESRDDDVLVLRHHGRRVARIVRDRRRWIAEIGDVRIVALAVLATREAARRFVERELWSEAGELVAELHAAARDAPAGLATSARANPLAAPQDVTRARLV